MEITTGFPESEQFEISESNGMSASKGAPEKVGKQRWVIIVSETLSWVKYLFVQQYVPLIYFLSMLLALQRIKTINYCWYNFIIIANSLKDTNKCTYLIQ